MVNIQVDINEKQDKIINMCKLLNNSKNKQESICEIIDYWGEIYSLSEKQIEEKIIEFFKNRWSSKNTHDREDWIKRAGNNLKKAYKEYDSHIRNFPELMLKKYKVSKRFIEEFMEEEQWTDDEDEMEETKASDKKIKIKIFNDFQDMISNWQDEIEKKYDCKIEHEEFFWSSKNNFGLLNMEYCGGKDIDYRLDSYVNEVIKEMIRIFRKDKDIKNII